MFGKILTAMIGEKLAGPNSGAKGAAIGYFAPLIARRMLGPIGLVLAGGYVAKKVLDARRERRSEA